MSTTQLNPLNQSCIRPPIQDAYMFTTIIQQQVNFLII
uniref:Uncharacterized protein n=1 Tax=Arundo donax TaxID=35708 RepID=A0A0A9FR67_ARUDO